MFRLFLIAILVAGCSAQSEPAKKRERPIVGKFQSQVHTIDTEQRVTMFDMPGYWEPTRCWVWESTRTNTSHMRCDTDVPEMPQASE